MKESKFIFNRIKKGEVQGKEKCHNKSMMSKEVNERLKRHTQYVPLSKDMWCLFATGLKKARVEGKQCHSKTMKSKRSW